MMKNLGDKLIRFILKNSFWITLVTFLITLGALYCLPRIKLDNSVDVFFNKKSKDYIDFQNWREQFGSDNIIIVAFKDEDIFTPGNLNLISRLTDKFERLQYVDEVTSLTNINDIIGSENDFIVKPMVEEIPATQEELQKLKQRALENPLYLKNVISPDGKTTAIIVELENRPQANDVYKKEVITHVKNILKEEFPKDKKYYLAGPTTVQHYYADYMQRDFKTFLPLILFIVFVVLILTLRGVAGVLLPLSVVLLSLIWTMAFLYLCGYSINNVTTVIPPIMISIALLESLHFVWELIEGRGENYSPSDAEEIIAKTMRHLFIPCLLTNVTTVIGFFALLITVVPPIRQMGWVSGIGVFLSFIITFTFLPALIKQFGLLNYLSAKQIHTGVKEKLDRLLLAFTDFSDKYKIPVLVVTGIVVIISVWATGKIKTETSMIEYFKKSEPIYKATIFIEQNLSGVHLLNISLKTDRLDYFKEPRALMRIEKLYGFLNGIPEVNKITSVIDYLKEINKSFHNEDENFYKIPDSQKLIAQYLLLYDAADLKNFVDSEWSWVTVRVRLKEHSTAKLKNVIAEIDDYLKQNFPVPIEAKTLGHTVLEVDVNEAVTSGQVQSLTLAIVLIFGMMFVDFRSISLGMISLVPNLFPLLLNFGIMGLLSIRLDSVTAVISDIGIGIIVDDTIHFYHSFGESVLQTGDYRQSLHRSFITKGTPTIITTLILILGFGVVSFSKFVPTYYFGVLSAVLMFNAMWSELLLSPALLMLIKPKFRRRG